MKTIYLASHSKARKELLRKLGIRFRVLTAAGVKEKRALTNGSYADLVKANALRKAEAVAKKINSGIVIGADTVSVWGNKIFGKPKNLKQARIMLKKFSRKPQVVYTGLAVIDKGLNPSQEIPGLAAYGGRAEDERGFSKREGAPDGPRGSTKTFVACERTKVYMDKLNDREITDYFSRVDPLDKAGSFDIQGRGAFFIRRIEGCFYNVVGLPLRKLYIIFRKLGLEVFISFWCFGVLVSWCTFLSGCSTEYNVATQKQETFYYNTDKEVQIGKSLVREVEAQYKPVDDPLVEARVEEIGKKLALVCDRKEIDYYFKALQDDEVNAFSLPGGFVYVNKGLIDKVSNDDELAAVLAHEIAHIVARHSIKKLQAMMGYSLLRMLSIAVPSGGGEVAGAADAAFTEILLGYNRQDELLADQLATRYLKLAGFNPHAMVTFLEKLQEVNRRTPLKPKTYFKTHPYVPDRIRVVKQELGERIDFKDYINIEEEKNE